MRRTILVAALAWCGGFCLASATAFGYAKLNAWRAFGENFQLGYVVGYLDAVTLSKRHDHRVAVPTGGKIAYERWRDLVNEFYADPANAERPLPDAMATVGQKLTEQMLKAWRERKERPSPGSSPAAPQVSGPTQAPAAREGQDASE